MKSLFGKDFFIQNIPVSIADTVLTKNEVTFIHNHVDFYEFFILKEGIIQHNLNGNVQTVSGKSLCFVVPEDVHSFCKDENCKKAIFLNVAFSIKLYAEVASFLENIYIDFSKVSNRVVPLNSDYYNILLDKVNLIQDITNQLSTENRISILKSIIADVLMLLIKNNAANKSYIPEWLSSSYNEMKKEENYISGLKRFIELSGKSHEHLSRYMKKYYNLTPIAYINLLRLYKVAQLLITTDMSILNLAYSTGFNNIAHFNKLFKDQYGLNPSSYRRVNKMITNPSS